MIIYNHVSDLLQVLRGSNQTQRKHQANKNITNTLKAKEIFDFNPAHFHLQPPGAEQQTVPESHYPDGTRLSVQEVAWGDAPLLGALPKALILNASPTRQLLPHSCWFFFVDGMGKSNGFPPAAMYGCLCNARQGIIKSCSLGQSRNQ